MTLLLDTFTDTAGNDLATHTGESGHTWSVHVGSGTLVFTDANRVRLGNASTISYKNSYAPPSADYAVVGVIRCVTNLDNQTGILARVASGANTFVEFRINPGSGIWELYQRVAGSFTSISTAAVTPQANTDYTLKLAVSGTAVEGYVNGVAVVGGTTSIADAGLIGLRVSPNFGQNNNTGWQFDSLDVLAGRPRTFVAAMVG